MPTTSLTASPAALSTVQTVGVALVHPGLMIRVGAKLVGRYRVVAGGTDEGLMVNAAFPDVPPPGSGLTTVTCPVPGAAMSAAVITACTWVALTNVVARLA